MEEHKRNNCQMQTLLAVTRESRTVLRTASRHRDGRCVRWLLLKKPRKARWARNGTPPFLLSLGVSVVGLWSETKCMQHACTTDCLSPPPPRPLPSFLGSGAGSRDKSYSCLCPKSRLVSILGVSGSPAANHGRGQELACSVYSQAVSMSGILPRQPHPLTPPHLPHPLPSQPPPPRQ